MSFRDILGSIPLFKDLNNEDLDSIAAQLHKESYPKGAIIFREGEVGDTMYLVESGQVAVINRNTPEPIVLMGPGNFVGEISLLLAQPRSASLRVTIDAQLWALKKKDFESLIATHPTIALAMMRELSRRLVATTHHPHAKHAKPRRRITALIGGHKALELTQAIYAQLRAPVGLMPLPTAKMARMGEVTISGGLMFLSSYDLTEASLAESLSHQVGVFKHIVVVLPEQPDPLAEKAAELAHTIVSIGQPPAWIRARDMKSEVWVISGSQDDLERTARRLTNRTVGLALSSGGSRGLAHIGVMKVLLEAGIPVDAVAGTSAGAWFGAFFAAGWSRERFDQFTEEIKTMAKWANWDFNIPPRTGIAKGRKARDKIIARSVDHQTFEDLKIPLYIVAADILTGDEVIFDSGPLADAIRASLSVPVLADPWHYQGRYLVDGGIVNPLPAKILHERGIDIVIASSVVQPLRQSYNGPRDRMPSIFQIIFNMFSAMEAEVIKKQFDDIDLLIQHQVSANHTLDFEQVNELVRVGEQNARRMLPKIREKIEMLPEA